MFDYGLEGYRPAWCQGRASVAERHGPVLSALLGRRLRNVWVGWQVGSDRWFPQLPVLLAFEGGDQIEVNHYRANDVSITRNLVDPTAPVRPVANIAVTWVDDRPEEMAGLRGQHLWAVDLLEWPSPSDDVAIGFAFSRTYLTVFNAGDANGLAFGPPDSHYRQYRLATALGPRRG